MPPESTAASDADTAEHRSLSLFQRYTALADDTARLRRERERLQEDLEAVGEQDRAIEQEEARLRYAATEAEQAAQGHGARLRDLKAELRAVDTELEGAVAARDAARRRRDAGEQHQAGERRAFLQAAVVFRESCRRLRVDAVACGLERTPVMAYMESVGMDSSLVERPSEQRMDDDDLEADPMTWTIDPDDDEMITRFEEYLQKKKLYDEADSGLVRTKESKEAVYQRIRERDQQEQSLHEQVDRILKENSDIEQQIHELELLTKEAEQRKADLIWRMSIHNPYKHSNTTRTVTPFPGSVPGQNKRGTKDSNSSKSAGTSGNDLSEARRSHVQDDILGMTAVNASPHLAAYRAGGGRYGRNQFGSRLQVDGGFLAPSEDPIDTDAYTAEPPISPETAQSLDDTSMIDEDDEEDDGTLDFVAFSGRKTGK